jgi:hypothetical protein
VAESGFAFKITSPIYLGNGVMRMGGLGKYNFAPFSIENGNILEQEGANLYKLPERL